MKKLIFLIVYLLMLMPAFAAAQDVLVTRNFTGLWDQPEHESQGINLQIINQASGEKIGVAYWFTYGDDMKTAWFLGTGPVVGNRIEMVLYEARDVGFLQANLPGNNSVREVGTLIIEFFSCFDGKVTFTTEIEAVGSGMFPIERLTDLHNSSCSGGVSDDTPANALPIQRRISLAPARSGVTASGHADFEERADRTEFSVEVEDLANGSYRIFVDGVDRGALMVSLGRGKTEFRSPVEAGKVLLTFDPRGSLIEVHDDQGAILTSGDSVFSGDDNNGGTVIDFGTAEIRIDLNNPGVYPAASGDAKLDPRMDHTQFSVEIEDVPAGSYTLRVGGDVKGMIQAAMGQDGTIRGELEFRNPVEPGKILLDFDPRGQQIEVLEGSTVFLQTAFPSG